MSSTEQAEKISRISAIDDEVKQFHPLLKTLLPKFPRVTQVEYTHGSSEMGADFIVHRTDDAFGASEAVAIVAKLGKMDQESISEIDRQIEECFIEKLTRNGKTTEFVSEVWVVSTGSFTQNAKIKIHNKHKAAKIIFLGRDQLIAQIDKYCSNYWTDVSLEIGDYLNILRNRNTEIEENLSLLKDHRDLYIEQDLVEIEENQYRSKKKQKKKINQIKVDEKLESSSAILIQGEMGSGKSKLLRQLVKHYTSPSVYLATNHIPIATTLKEVSETFSFDLEKLIQSKINSTALSEISKETIFLFLIDGVDEKNASTEERLKSLKMITGMIEKQSNWKVIMATRPLDSIQQDKELLKRLTRIEIKPMSLRRVILFIEEICRSISIPRRIFEDLRKSPLFKQLPATPIAALLLAELLRENTQDLPSNLPELYTKYLELMLGRWDMEKGLQSLKEYEAQDQLMTSLASFSLDNEISHIPIPDAERLIRDYLGRRKLDISLERMNYLMFQRSGILTCDRANNRITFKHRTFSEYFYAKSKIRSRNLTVDERAFNVYWSNVYYFYIGILKDCPELLEDLRSVTLPKEGERFFRMINFGHYLLAGFSSPYDVIEDGIKTIFIDAAEYYQSIVTRKLNSSLAQYSEMQLLWIFQYFLRQSYSYNFFKDALESVALRIGSDSEISDSTKAFALFFLNVSYIDTTEKGNFDFILKDYAEILPLSVQFGIRHESDKLKERSALMRKQDRAIRGAMKGNKHLRDVMNAMYEKPLTQRKLPTY